MNGETMLSDKEALKKLFVGGIPIPLTDKEFTAYFKNYGEVADSVIIKDSTTKKSRGFGFITFTNYQDLNGVLQSRPHSFDNKEVEVKRAIPRENNSDTAHIRCKKLFVGGVPKDGDEEQLKSDLNTLYGHCGLGTVTKVDFIKDRESGKNKGYGFIEVDSEDLADLIIIYDHKPKLNGKLMEIKKAEERGAKRGAGVTRGGARVGGRGGRGGGGGGGYGGYSGGEYGGASESYSGGFGGPQDSFVGGGGGGGGGYGGGYRDSSYGGGYSNGGGYGSGQSYGGGAGGYGGGYGGSAYGEGASGYGNTPTGGYGDYGMGNSGGYGQQTSGFGPSRGGRSSGGGGGSGGSGGGRRYQPY